MLSLPSLMLMYLFVVVVFLVLPMSCSVSESAVVSAPALSLFRLIAPLTFSYAPSIIVKSEVKGQRGGHADIVTIGQIHQLTFKDKTIQDIECTMAGEVGFGKFAVSWRLVDSDPGTQCLAKEYKVMITEVTETKDSFVEWETKLSRDCSNEMLLDAKYKACEHLAAMKQFVARVK